MWLWDPAYQQEQILKFKSHWTTQQERIYCWHNYGVKQETEQGMSSEVWFLGFLLCLSYLSIAGIKIPWPPGQGAWQQPRCRRVSGVFIHICSTSERQRGLIWNGVDFWTSKPHSSHRSPPTSPCLLILPKLLHQLRTMCSNTWAHCGGQGRILIQTTTLYITMCGDLRSNVW